MRLASLLALASLSGCTLYFGNGDDENECHPLPQYEGQDVPARLEVRDPYTGECYGGGGGGECYYDGDCNYICSGGAAPTPTMPGGEKPNGAPGEDSATEPYPSGAQCNSYCDSLDEYSCQQTAGCQAAYDISGLPFTPYLGCWATDTTSPDASGQCAALDAYACSTRDDCTMNYDSTKQYPYKTTPIPPVEPGHEFAYCGTEGGGYGCAATDCAPGYHCVDSCYDTTTPGGMDPNGGALPPECTPTCVPDNNTCDTIDILCGPGYQCADICDVTNDSPMGGSSNCYPACVPTTACEALTTQQACDGRGDCSSVYDGDNCTCYENGFCECETLTWDRCESYGVNGMGL